MKKYTILLPIFLLILSISVFITTKVSATVGGETLIYDFKYNPSDESVYYTLTDGGGRGCYPGLMKVSLNSEKSTTVFSCDQGEKLGFEQSNSEIDKITKNFKILIPLSLKTNNISVDVKFVKAETYGSESNDVMMRYFTASIYQNGKKVKEFPITGCTIEQPFTFQGYSIPGFNKKIILLISAKNNCGEGGYIYESLQVVGGVDNLDKTQIGNFYKRSFPLLPNEGNLVIYESDTNKTTNDIIKNELAVKEIVATSTVPTIEKPIKEFFFTRLINWFRNLF